VVRYLASLVTPTVAHHGRHTGRRAAQQVPACLLDAIDDCIESHEALVQETRLIRLDRVALGVETPPGTILLPRQSGPHVLSKLSDLPDSRRRYVGRLGRKGVDPAYALVRGRGERYGL